MKTGMLSMAMAVTMESLFERKDREAFGNDGEDGEASCGERDENYQPEEVEEDGEVVAGVADKGAPTGGYLVKNVNGIGRWVIEGIDGLDDDIRCHMMAFYANLKVWHSKRGYTTIVLTKAEYKE